MTLGTTFIFITGGVLSGLGKGVVSASIGKLLSPKLRIVPIKCDGYLNVDPGTMNPIEHGEVFVLDDGGECDLDFGHYERFLNINCKQNWSITSGKVFQSLVEKERRGDFLGKTVQVIPHATGEIVEKWKTIATVEQADVMLIEVGGTVGDYENPWFLWAAKDLRNELGSEKVLFAHIGLLPVIDAQGQQKTKPLQQSVTLLQTYGIFPDILVGRSVECMTEESKSKLRTMCNTDMVVSDPNLPNVYELPLVFAKEDLHTFIQKRTGLELNPSLTKWKGLVKTMKEPKTHITVAVCGKYTDLADSYISIAEALKHAGAHLGVESHIEWIETTDFEKDEALLKKTFANIDAMIIPGGFGTRGTEGKIAAIKYARENNIPFLGICYGLQLAIAEIARSKCGLEKANSTEIDVKTPHPVVHILEEQKKITDKGATMRLGAYPADLLEGCKIQKLYATLRNEPKQCSERHRHRYEVNPEYHKTLKEHGVIFSGMSPNGELLEFFELGDHPYFVVTQAHPELKSRLESPAPLFYGLVDAANKKEK